ncbi:hypothetical protein KSS87_004958 [Heliosperma pusillum]|nr:hypothetical protein KSS87_004958 [Heliosperma pusillum]
MKSSTLIDSIAFQLTPTRTRCDLVITANGKTEKIASGLLDPFLAHLKAAQEQIGKGGYSIVLKPSHGSDTSWFTKGTVERFANPSLLLSCSYFFQFSASFFAHLKCLACSFEEHENALMSTSPCDNRFVRFVSTPEILERAYTIESEILQIEKAISLQSSSDTGLHNAVEKPLKREESLEGIDAIASRSFSLLSPFKSKSSEKKSTT